ncbi:ribonuclease E inhibitor RraB [Pseudoalteromonas mariniglutinosa]|uniref:ribonuclease E inhibitor RraB n=1 Tax=Pseudoalteromonas mariniglutinosa TaxID=206042 RepID=UPI00384A7C74
MHASDNENAQLLAEIAAAGIDLNLLHDVDFYILFEQKAEAEKFASVIINDELAPELELVQCDDTGIWEVITRVKMVPEHTLLGQTEQYLESIANSYNGYGDGWGLMADD